MKPLLALLLTVLPAAAFAEAPQRPNVLFLMSDDLNNALGCYGNSLARTPNLDKLAARGTRFDRAYCTYPLCGPSRNSMLTGLYPNSNGILLNAQIFRQTIPSHVSLPQAFRQSGYLAVRIGKLYHYGVPGSVGTDGHDDPASWEQEFNPAGVDRLEEEPKIFSLTPGNFGSSLSWYASPKSDEHHTDGMLASDAQWVLERCAKEKQRPFFLAVGFFRPHTPFNAPKVPYFDWHDKSKMPLVQGVEEDEKDIPAAALASRKNEEKQLTDDLSREAIQAYYASISFMDAQLGRVIETLDRLGLSDNTIIVFTSDHGYHLGEHGLWKKQSLFEESARVPMLVVAPGITSPGSVAKTPVSHLDLYPTLAELCKVETPGNLQGQSLVPILHDADQVGRGWALAQMVRGGGGGKRSAGRAGRSENNPIIGYTLRTPRYRYTQWDEGRAGSELYDHDADPRELTNLVSAPEHAETVRDLSEKLREAVASTFPPDGETPQIRDGLWAPVLQ